MPVQPVVVPGQAPAEQKTPPSIPPLPFPGLSPDPLPSSCELLADRPDTAPDIWGWGADSGYEIDSGLRSSPVAGPPGTPAAFWRIHAGYCKRKVPFHCEAIGGKPELPSGNTGSGNEVLIFSNLSPQVPQVNADGLPIWTVNGGYELHLQVCPSASDTLGVGRHPLSVMTPEMNTLTPYDFQQMFSAAVVDGYNGNVINF